MAKTVVVYKIIFCDIALARISSGSRALKVVLFNCFEWKLKPNKAQIPSF